MTAVQGGFKKLVRSGLELGLGEQQRIDLVLEVVVSASRSSYSGIARDRYQHHFQWQNVDYQRTAGSACVG